MNKKGLLVPKSKNGKPNKESSNSKTVVQWTKLSQTRKTLPMQKCFVMFERKKGMLYSGWTICLRRPHESRFERRSVSRFTVSPPLISIAFGGFSVCCLVWLACFCVVFVLYFCFCVCFSCFRDYFSSFTFGTTVRAVMARTAWGEKKLNSRNRWSYFRKGLLFKSRSDLASDTSPHSPVFLMHFRAIMARPKAGACFAMDCAPYLVSSSLN